MYYIEVNGQRSDHLGLKMLMGMDRLSAENDTEEIEVLGKDGVYIRDNQRKRAINRRFEFTIQDDLELVNSETKLTEWLDFVGFQDAILSWDDTYIYRIRPARSYQIEELIYKFGRVMLEFQFQPVKFAQDGRVSQAVESGDVLTNHERGIAQPVITITGRGDMSLFINGRETRFENVQDGIVIDSLSRSVYWDSMQQWNKLIRLSENDFPYFDRGENEITFTGDITQVDVIPNWGVKL